MTTVWSVAAAAPVPSITRACVSATTGASTLTNSRTSGESVPVCVYATTNVRSRMHAPTIIFRIVSLLHEFNKGSRLCDLYRFAIAYNRYGRCQVRTACGSGRDVVCETDTRPLPQAVLTCAALTFSLLLLLVEFPPGVQAVEV